MKENPVVIISSTARDLPDYRAQVMDACLRVGMFPQMMEHLPALDADAIRASLDLVDNADVYVGLFAHRYGYVPAGHDISVTQMEYERAVERGIPRLVFLMHDDVPVLPKDFEKGEAAEKLETLKSRLMRERVLSFFKNPEDLRGLVVHSLGEVRKQLDDARPDQGGQPTPAELARSLHYVSEIPQPSEPYIAHPYTLLQVRGLVGRKEEMELLTDWVTGELEFKAVRVLNVVAIGGMGKSALTWTWFNEVAPQEMSPLAGRVWWSFYESDATFENFVMRTLAYVTRRPLDQVRQLSAAEREYLLLRVLDQQPFLVVLDGLERILVAYARADAAYVRDHETLDEETANRVAGAYGLPKSAGQSFVGRHKLRMTADPRAGRFLRELGRVGASRVLISTRLYPADLQAPGGSPSPGCEALFLPGLSDQDALELWRAYGAKGSREVMLPVFHTFDKHPLLLQLLACEVAEFREFPGDFDAWRAATPDFNPFGLELANVQSHVLHQALRGLSPAETRALHVAAGFRMPASMETLKALLVRTSSADDPAPKPFATLADLDRALVALEDRGLLGWDRRANRYDLHPIIRGVVWAGLDDATRLGLYHTLRTHFEAMPMAKDYLEVESVDELTPAVELYHTLIGLQAANEAYDIFRQRLDKHTLYRLSASRLRVQLLEALFPDGTDAPPLLTWRPLQYSARHKLAQGYQFSGMPSAAVSLYRIANAKAEGGVTHGVVLTDLSTCLRVAGQLRGAEAAAREALVIFRRHYHRLSEGVSLYVLGRTLASRGAWENASRAFRRSLRLLRARNEPQSEGVVNALLGELALWRGDAPAAREFADQAWELAEIKRLERDFIHAAHLQGVVALHLGDYETAGRLLHHALLRARTVSHVEEELRTLIALAEWHRRQGDTAPARALLDEVWDPAEQGPYPLFHADALDVLAQIEQDAGNPEAAVEAATKAYRLAWCDGPPFAYHWGLEKAKAHLAALGAPEPEMPPFDESQHEPMPEVEINPPDGFGVSGEEHEFGTDEENCEA
jgi:tetratricopeptide (TPR) repeat protein